VGRKPYPNKERRYPALRIGEIDEYLASHPCQECGNDDVRVLQFHHRDPRKKSGSPKRMACSGFSREAIMREIAKCDVLCANCHLIVHHTMREKRNGTNGHR
jgi:hypothetical protein